MLSRQVRRHMPGQPGLTMDAIMDLQTWTQWRPGLVAVSNVSDQPVLSGSAWVEEWRIGNRTVRLLARSVEVDAPNAFTYTATGDGFEVMFRWVAKGDDDRTLVVRDARARAVGLRNWLSHGAQEFLRQQDAALDMLRLILRRRLNPHSFLVPPAQTPRDLTS